MTSEDISAQIFDQSDPPVTVDILQQVKPGCETAFEEVLLELIEAAKSFTGHLGVNVFRTSGLDSPEYRIVFKFDHLSNLRRWEESSIRQQWLARAQQLTVGTGKLHTLTGLETWFTLSTQQPILPPPRYKMLILTLLTIFPLLNLLTLLLTPLLQPLPPLLRSFVVMLLLLTLSTYVVMPRVTRLFKRWLYPKSRTA